jgi:beta-lactamase regulating signal transducer with metallopeptidase domain
MLLALYFTINHLICRHEYKKASLCKDIDITKYYAELNVRRKVRILASNRVTSPLTYGLISPCIIFPHKMDFNDSMHLRNILIHELTHIKRFDVMFKFLLTACLCLHWFNPFIWLMFFIANRDIELSCDEFVLKNLSVDDKKLYALSLLDFCNKIIEPNICAGFAVKNNIEERIVAIVKSNSANKRDLKVKITSTLVCAFIFAFSGIALSAFGISSSIINEVEISSNLKVPNCINMTLEEARTYLLSNGFEVIIQSTN